MGELGEFMRETERLLSALEHEVMAPDSDRSRSDAWIVIAGLAVGIRLRVARRSAVAITRKVLNALDDRWRLIVAADRVSA